MRMTRLEKVFVNRERKGRRNAETVNRLLAAVGASRIGDVLEVGCGTGLASTSLAHERGARVIASDVDPEEVLLASRMSEEHHLLRFEVQDATALRFADCSFDLVIAQMVFHHIPAWTQAVSEIARVLRPKGLLVWQDLVFPGWLKRVASSASKNYGSYTLRDVRSEFSACGFAALFHGKSRRGPSVHHYMVLQKKESEACPTLLGRNVYRQSMPAV